jgi:glycine C-acetyltransferase
VVYLWWKKAGFDIIDGDSAIVPVMLYDAKLSQNMADELKKDLWVSFGGP